MKFDSKQLAEILGITAVIFSLIFVAWELRQSNRIAIAAAESELRTANRELSSLVAENLALSETIAKARNDIGNLTPAEEVSLHNYAQASFNVLTQANAAHVNGLLTSYSLDIFKESIVRNFRDYPFLVHYFARNVSDYSLYSGNSELWTFLVDELGNHGYTF